MIRPIIYTLVGIPLLVYACYFVALGMFSFKKKGRIPYAPAQKRLAVVLPARNEEAVIGQLVETLRAQNYPSELFDVFVAPNHCTDRTAEIAAERGAKVLSISDEVKSKGDVLREVFAQLTQDDTYDAFVVFDSDNLACPDFLQRMNDAMCAGYEVVQGNRDSKNPGDTWISGDTSIYYWLLNTFVHKARMNIDSSAVLNGTGLLISRKALRIVGYDVKSLTEDIEFSTMCAIKGVRIAYAEEAVFYDEQPLGLWDSLKQRKRWSVGCYECLRYYWKDLVSGIVGRKSLACSDMLMMISAPLMQVLLMVVSVLMGIDIAIGLYPGVVSGVFLIAFSLISGLLSYLLQVCMAIWGIALSKKNVRMYLLAAVTFPIFIMTWIPVNLVTLLHPKAKWDPIKHSRVVNVQSVVGGAKDEL